MRFAAWTFWGFLVACGGTRAPDLTAWDSEVDALRLRVGDYKTKAPTTSAPADCQHELGLYRTDMEPRLQRMRMMSGDMDNCMNAMGHRNEADLAKNCSDMDAELARYANEGCLSADAPKNRADAEAHCGKMLEYLDLSTTRSQSMNGMMGSGMMGGGMCR